MADDDARPDSRPDPRPDQAEDQPHRDTGLDLARSIARAVAARTGSGGGPRARRSGTGGTGGTGGGAGGRRGRRRSTEPQVSGAHPDDRDPQTLDSTIGRFIAQQGWERDVRVHGVFSRWSAIVGPEVALHAQPVGYTREPTPTGEEGGRLVVQTDSTAWATQMRLLASTVLARLNAELGDGTVTFIEVRGPSAPRWSHGRRSVRGGRGPRDTYG